MIIPFHVTEMLRRVRAKFDAPDPAPTLAPQDTPVQSLRPSRKASAGSIGHYLDQLGLTGASRDAIADTATLDTAETYSANIENMIGTVKLPVGVIGPLRVNGVNAQGDYPVPLATTEAALVASYGRGAMAANKAGGIATAVL